MNWQQQDKLLRKNQCPICGNKMRNSNMWEGNERVPVKECGHCGERWFEIGNLFCRIERTKYKTHAGI